MSSRRSWYLIYTKPRQEKMAQENLERQGFVTYLPLTQQTRRRNGRYIKVIEAYFPRYLFIRLNTDTDNWAPIRSTFGVSQMICFGGIPAVVPDELINTLKQNDDSNGIQKLVEQDLSPGNEVVIVAGPFENKAAAILCLGYLGNPDALPILYKLQKSKNKLIRDFSSASIKRLEHVQ